MTGEPIEEARERLEVAREAIADVSDTLDQVGADDTSRDLPDSGIDLSGGGGAGGGGPTDD